MSHTTKEESTELLFGFGKKNIKIHILIHYRYPIYGK